MEFGVGIKFHGTFKVPWNSMELPFWPGKVPWNSMEFHGTSGEFHGIPWNSMELWNIDIDKFHNWGSVFHCFLYDFMSLYIRQSISSWNIEIFQFQSNFLVPLILVKWRYSILNCGLLNIFRVTGPLCVEFTGEFPSQRPVTRGLDIFFDLRLNKRLSKQSRGWWLETPSGSLWRHFDDITVHYRYDVITPIPMCSVGRCLHNRGSLSSNVFEEI